MNKLANVYKIPVVLASERIQYYHRNELPSYIRDKIPQSNPFVPVLKKYEALADAIKDLEELPLVLNHVGDIKPDDPRIIGYVRDIVADDNSRKIKGWAYLIKSKLDSSLKNRIEQGDIIDVSVDGWVIFGDGGQYKGRNYFISQEKIGLQYLAVLPNAEGRCPSGICGLNLKDENSDFERFSIENKLTDEISRANVKLHKDVEEDLPDPINLNYIDKLGSKGDFINENNTIEDKSQNLDNSNIESLGDNNMPETIEELKSKLTDAEKRILDLSNSVNQKRISELEQALKDEKQKSSTLSETLDIKSKELKDISEKLQKLEDEKKKLDDIRKTELVNILSAVGLKKEELEKLCLHDLNVKYSTLVEAKIIDESSKIKNFSGFKDMPSQAQRDQKVIGLTDNKITKKAVVNFDELAKKLEVK